MAKFWTNIFALTFALGVATGLVMEFEFGTNWASYSRFVGDIFGSTHLLDFPGQSKAWQIQLRNHLVFVRRHTVSTLSISVAAL